MEQGIKRTGFGTSDLTSSDLLRSNEEKEKNGRQ